jgi:predicted RNA binding protein YcfA (HicA-like mRNA interferase family)
VSPRLKTLAGRDVIIALRHFGFEVVATRHSHAKAKLRRDGPGGARHTLTIPLHKELATGTLLAMYRQHRGSSQKPI